MWMGRSRPRPSIDVDITLWNRSGDFFFFVSFNKCAWVHLLIPLKKIQHLPLASALQCYLDASITLWSTLGISTPFPSEHFRGIFSGPLQLGPAPLQLKWFHLTRLSMFQFISLYILCVELTHIECWCVQTMQKRQVKVKTAGVGLEGEIFIHLSRHELSIPLLGEWTEQA